MTNAGVPVPPGFTITTDVCRYYYANKQKPPKELEAQQKAAMERLQKIMVKGFGNPENPLLVSVSFWRQVLHARHDGHDLKPRLSTTKWSRASPG